MSRKSTQHVAGAFALASLLAAPMVAQSLADALTRATTLEVVPLVQDYESVVLTIAGPDDIYIRREFAAAEAVSIDLAAELGSSLRDGQFTWEMVFVPRQLNREDAGGELSAEAAESRVESGSFSIADGVMVNANLPEAPLAKDILHNDDVIITGSLCVGFDCVNNESFGFDTIRLKENNLRIKFQDTSTGSFPSVDWQLTANDSTNGGANRFSIDDIDGGKTPFTIVAGAPSNSLYVDAQGDVGLNTSNPVVELHVVDGDSPTLRLEQNGSSGFTPQTWDLAGNETNFFVRDVTNGSKLPFKILPGADDNALVIDSDNNIGIGIRDALDAVHIRNAQPQVRMEDSDAGGNTWRFGLNNAGDFVINEIADLGVAEFQVTEDGAVIVNGTTVHPDYVFAPDYELMPLADLQEYVRERRHLPGVQSAQEREEMGGIDLSSLPLQILEKVEELTLYTLQQQREIDALRQENEHLKARVEELD